MQCGDFETRLHDLLDLRQAPEADATLRQHAQACAECRELLVAMTAAVGELERWEIPAAPRELPHRVAAEIQPLQVASRQPVKNWWRMAAAAATAAAVWLMWGMPGWRVLQQPEAPAVVQQQNDVGAQQDVAAGPMVEATTIAADKLRELHEQTRESLALAWLAVPGMTEPTPDEAPPPAQQATWGQELSETLSPVTRSTTGALESLWQTLAPAGEDTTS